ncbi:MAG: hypothetical protein ABIK09_08950 [Pseudomonadota bacterium]
MTKGSHRWVVPWLILGVYWVCKTAAIWRHLGTRHFGMRAPLIDVLGMQWMSWWTSLAAHSPHHSLFFSDKINFPLGAPSILDDSLAFLHIGVAGLLRGPLGAVPAINLTALAGFSFTIIAVYVFLRSISGERNRAAVLTCLVVSAGLCIGNQLPELEFVFFGYLPFTLFAWTRFLSRGSRRWCGIAIGLVGLTCYAQMYYGISLLLILGLALALSLAGVPVLGHTPPVVRRRTAVVLSGGLGVAALFHARNIYNLVIASAVVRSDLGTSMPWRFGVLDCLLLLLLFVLPMALAWRTRSRCGAHWAILALPILIFSAGNYLISPGNGVVHLPLYWVRMTLPFLWRITYSERFVTPMVLLVGASVLASLRCYAGPEPAPHPLRRAAIITLTFAAFWWGVTATPLVTLAEANHPMQEVFAASDYPPPETPVKVLVDTQGAGPSKSMWGNRSLPWARIPWLFLPLDTVALPPIPHCIAEIGSIPGDFALLELSTSIISGYRAYFQTVHGKRVVGFPFRPLWLGTLRVPPSQLTSFQMDFQLQKARALDSRDDLAGLGIRFVILYTMPYSDPGIHRAPGFSGRERGRKFKHADFESAYGPPTCVDELVTVYSVSSE